VKAAFGSATISVVASVLAQGVKSAFGQVVLSLIATLLATGVKDAHSIVGAIARLVGYSFKAKVDDVGWVARVESDS
jgi:hypothetical protein